MKHKIPEWGRHKQMLTLPNSSCSRLQPSGWHNDGARLRREKPLLLAVWHTRTPRRGQAPKRQRGTPRKRVTSKAEFHTYPGAASPSSDTCSGQANQGQQPWDRPPACWGSATLHPTTPPLPPLALSSGVTIQAVALLSHIGIWPQMSIKKLENPVKAEFGKKKYPPSKFTLPSSLSLQMME